MATSKIVNPKARGEASDPVAADSLIRPAGPREAAETDLQPQERASWWQWFTTWTT